MCYSAKCHFQDWDGECQIKNFKKFQTEIGEPACYVGGVPDDEESDKYIEEHKEYFRELRKLAYEKELIR